MKIIKKTSFWISVTILAFLLAYQPVMLKAQSVEKLNGINSGIGGDSGEIATDDNSDNTTVYVIVGALVVGVALYYYLKWAAKKRPAMKKETVSLQENNKKGIINSDKSLINKSIENKKNIEELEELVLP